MTALSKALIFGLGIAVLGGAGYAWMTRTNATFRVSGVHALDGDDVVVAYHVDDGGETRTTHVARRSPADGSTAWELELPGAVLAGNQQGMTVQGKTLVVADRPAPDAWRVRGVDTENGGTQWTRTLPGQAERWPDLFGTNDHVFVVGSEPRLQVLEVGSGEVVFEHDFKLLGPPLFNERWLLASNDETGVSFVDLTTMTLTSKLPAIDGEVCLIGDAVYGISSASSSSAAIVRQDLETGDVTRFDAGPDHPYWPPATTSCGWLKRENRLRLVFLDLNGQLDGFEIEPERPAEGAAKIFDLALDGGKVELDAGLSPNAAARSLRGELARFELVKLIRPAESGVAVTYGVVDLLRGVLSSEGAPFPDGTTATIEWTRDPREHSRVLINAEWWEQGGVTHGHVGVFDGTTGTLVADMEGAGVSTQAAAVGASRTWLWAEKGFSETMPIFAYDAAFQPLASESPTDLSPQASDKLGPVFGVSSAEARREG